MSDLNYLFNRQQTEKRLATEAHCVEARLAHEALARAYARTIADHHKPASASTI